MKYHTIGEIFRLGLLKNYKGEPYRSKAEVSRVVRLLDFKIQHTPWGEAKVVSEKEIEKHNKKWK